MHLSHFLWSNDPGAVLVFLPLYTAQLQMPKILKTSIHKGYIQDWVKPQNASKVSEVIIPPIFCSLFIGVNEDIEIELECLSFPCLIPYCWKTTNLVTWFQPLGSRLPPSFGYSCFNSILSSHWSVPLCIFLQDFHTTSTPGTAECFQHMFQCGQGTSKTPTDKRTFIFSFPET